MHLAGCDDHLSWMIDGNSSYATVNLVEICCVGDVGVVVDEFIYGAIYYSYVSG